MMMGDAAIRDAHDMTPFPALAALGAAEAINVAGEDAVAFLQAQLASDLRPLQPGRWQWSAWLDARGRVRVLCQLARLEDRLLLLLRGGDAAGIATDLQRYVFRLRVKLEAQRLSLGAGEALESGRLLIGPDDTIGFGFGERSLVVRPGSTTGHDADDDALAAFRLADIRAGLPCLPPAAMDTLLPPALSLYRLGAVATNKGCYPGQELVNRLQRGDHKWRLRRTVRQSAWSDGDAIALDGRDVGLVLACAADEALVVLRDDAAAAGAARILETFDR